MANVSKALIKLYERDNFSKVRLSPQSWEQAKNELPPSESLIGKLGFGDFGMSIFVSDDVPANEIHVVSPRIVNGKVEFQINKIVNLASEE